MQIPADLHYILIMQKNNSTGNNYNIYCTCKKWCASAVFLSCFTAQMSTIDTKIYLFDQNEVIIIQTLTNICSEMCSEKKG